MLDPREVSLRRLQRLQSLCDDPGAESLAGRDGVIGSSGRFSALLLVAGADGRDNPGSNAVLRWLLLGESGAGVLDGVCRPYAVPRAAAKRLLPAASSGTSSSASASSRTPAQANAAASDLVDELGDALEETVVIVRRRSVSVFYDARAATLLAPIVAGWPALTEHTLTPGAADDLDVAERQKVLSFVAMCRTELERVVDDGETSIAQPGGGGGGGYAARARAARFAPVAHAVLGVPLPHGAGLDSGAADLERWPLLQAYGLDEIGGVTGFFTMRHRRVVDASAALRDLLAQVRNDVSHEDWLP